MKFLNFIRDTQARLGALRDDGSILDLTSVWPDATRPDSVDALIQGGEQALRTAAALMADADAGTVGAHAFVPFENAALLPPVSTTGRNIFNVGRNYHEHIIEGNIANGRPPHAFPPAIEFFTKPRTALAAHRGSVQRHASLTDSLDYEVELAIVIGKGGRDIPKAKAFEHIFGYTILNDITARDLQKKHGQWFKGKSLDTTCPLGPVIVHASAISNPDNLSLELDIDGELRQSDNTNSMIFDVATIVQQLSSGMTLEPGDVIATGTPKGVGFALNPPRCLEVGQTIRARVEGIGELSNTVVE